MPCVQQVSYTVPRSRTPCLNRCPPCLVPQAQEEYERRLKEEIDAKLAKEQEIERLVGGVHSGVNAAWVAVSESA